MILDNAARLHNNMKQKAAAYLSYFTTSKRDNGQELTHLREDAPQELRDSIYEAHGNALPSDWIYATYRAILEKITEYDESTDPDEIVESVTDIYTHDLCTWLAESNYNIQYLTDALEEYAPKDGIQALQMAQQLEIREIYQTVENLLTV